MAFRRPSSGLVDPRIARPAEPQTMRLSSAAGSATRDLPGDDRSFLAEVFRSHALPAALAERLLGFAMAPAHAPRPVDRLAIALASHFNFLALDEVLRAPVMLYGLPGTGVSTLAAKLAARFDEREVLVIAAGARDTAQLADDLDVLGLGLTAAADAAAVRKAVGTADGRLVIIDAGTGMLADAAFTRRMNEFREAAGAEGLLVLAADAGSDEAAAQAAAAERLGTRRMIITKLDTVRSLGGPLTAADLGKLALVAGSITPNFAFGLRNFTPENLARRLAGAAMRVERWRAAPL
jgi:signal recognition particle GTPase